MNNLRTYEHEKSHLSWLANLSGMHFVLYWLSRRGTSREALLGSLLREWNPDPASEAAGSAVSKCKRHKKRGATTFVVRVNRLTLDCIQEGLRSL